MKNWYHRIGMILFIQVYANFATCKEYYITSSLSTSNPSCPQDLCLTLSQLAASSNHYFGNHPNITLFFLSGNHSLDHDLLVTDAENFSMVNAHNSNKVFVKCASKTGRIKINQTTVASIKGLHFIGCGSNTITQVDQFTLEGTVFQGLGDSSTALVLNGIVAARIRKSLFDSNVCGTFRHHIETLESLAHNLGRVFPELNASATVGGAIFTIYSNVWIDHSTFYGNSAELGAAIYAEGKSNISTSNCQYINNKGNYSGSSLANILFVDKECTMKVSNSTFIGNTAGGGVITLYKSTISIDDSIFLNNMVMYSGGALVAYKSVIKISRSTFNNNTAAEYGGVFFMYYSNSLHIADSIFSYNIAYSKGGVIVTDNDSINIINGIFNNNMAGSEGGVIITQDRSSLNVADSTFSNNIAGQKGGVIDIFYGSHHIYGSTFNNNTCGRIGGVMTIFGGSLRITESTFYSNTAYRSGIIDSERGASLQIVNSSFSQNTALIGNLYFLQSTVEFIGSTTYVNNLGSIYMHSSNVSFNGYNQFKNCMEHPKEGHETQEGGVVTAYMSNIFYTGVTKIEGNIARQGGAILATQSNIYLYGQTTIANNLATMSGGGVHLYQSDLQVGGHSNISQNNASSGGGIHAISSTITVREQGDLQFKNNTATNGGGVYLEANAQLYILKDYLEEFFTSRHSMMKFIGNQAEYGGAVCVADETNYDACAPFAQCFIQVLAYDEYLISRSGVIDPVSLYFTENLAAKQGSNVYGGLLDRCIPSNFAQVYQHDPSINDSALIYSGVTYLQMVSNITLDSIDSQAVRICFCIGGKADCSYQHPPIWVKKGEAFTISVTAVDQVNHSVAAIITSSISSFSSGLGEGQHSRRVKESCTDLVYNVFSHGISDKIRLFAEGPCKDVALSTRNLQIHYKECTCPIGFQPLNITDRCDCICDPALSPFITECDPSTNLLARVKTNSWISYINETDSGYVIFQNCPYDYCYPSTENVSMISLVLTEKMHNVNSIVQECCVELVQVISVYP